MSNHSRIVVILVFGLPASGKTTLIKSIQQSIKDGVDSCDVGRDNGKNVDSCWYCWEVITDEIIPRSHQKEATENGDWKHVRRSLIQATGLLIDGIKTGHMLDDSTAPGTATSAAEAVPFYFMICGRNSCNCQKVEVATTATDHKERNHVILVEDNMYYKSMRYEWIKMCRSKHVALGAINCSLSLDECLFQNSLRSSCDCIPEGIIRRMAQLFEPATKDEFYGNLVEVQNQNEAVLAAIKLIHSAVESPLEPIPDDQDKKEIDRRQTSSNLIHQLDHVLRLATKEILSDCGSGKQQLARSLSDKKFVILADVRQSKLILPQWFIDSLTKKDGTSQCHQSERLDRESITYARNLLQSQQMYK